MATPMFDTNWIPSTLLKAILFVEWLYSYPNSIARRSSKGRQIDLNEGFGVHFWDPKRTEPAFADGSGHKTAEPLFEVRLVAHVRDKVFLVQVEFEIVTATGPTVGARSLVVRSLGKGCQNRVRHEDFLGELAVTGAGSVGHVKGLTVVEH